MSAEVVVACVCAAPFVLAGCEALLAGDREHNRPGLIWNRDGWKDPDPELIEKLEQWELNWRSGCYDESSDCEHRRGHDARIQEISNRLKRATDRYDAWSALEIYGSELEDARAKKLECVVLDNEFKDRFVFAALKTHTQSVKDQVELESRWNNV